MSKRNKKNDSDDEEDSCVLVGTPLVDLIPEDAKFSVKPKRPEDQIVTDEKGRQRFHGAFTGGFSAGYFNTVGTKEGWAPSSFKSSRNERADLNKFQRAEDFMDEEDFAEYGIAPKSLVIKSDFKDQSTKNETGVQSKKNYGSMFLDDMIRPARNTIGVKMLRKMGWREGTGIGPKIKRKLRKLKTKQNFEPGRKIYGVSLPSESDESDEFEDEYLVSTFDVNEFQFEVKEDQFGLGYKRLDVGSLFGNNNNNNNNIYEESPAASLLFPMANQKKTSKKAITGHAFGVGEYEDEDDVDIYQHDSMEKYDFGDSKKQNQQMQKLLNKSYGFGAFDSDVSIIKKFAQSKIKQEPVKIFLGPIVPQGFILIHKFPDGDNTNLVGVSEIRKKGDDSINTYLKSVSERSELLGEEVIKPDSVFDLISPNDREYLQKQKLKQLEKVTSSNEFDKDTISKLSETRRKNVEIDKEKKMKRYQEFKSFILKNYKDPYSFLDTKELNEWEKEKEKDEFYKMYEQSKKIEAIKKDTVSKFVSVSILNEQNQEMNVIDRENKELKDQDNKIDKNAAIEINEELTDIQRAAKQKNYGKLTRVEYEWRPNPVVCKRFNVPNPYPDSKDYGTVSDAYDRRKAPKFSLFNVLTGESRFDKEKSKSLFDEINADMPAKIGPSFAKTVNLFQEKGSNEKPKIEFETKETTASTSKNFKSDYLSIMEEKQTKEEPIEKTIRDDNVYLQERPAIDLFKAIFDDNDDEGEEKIEEKPDDLDEEIDDEIQVKSSNENQSISSVLPSSIGTINLSEVKKYTKLDDDIYVDNNKGEEREVENLSNTVKFTKILKDIAKKKSLKKKDNSSDSDDSSSSDETNEQSSIKSDKSSDVEIVYEEVSISNDTKKSSSHKKSKSKKKKHKKKSKKSKHKKKSHNDD